MLKLAVREAVTWSANMVEECEMSVVSDGFSGAQPITKSSLTFGLNITPNTMDFGKAQEGT